MFFCATVRLDFTEHITSRLKNSGKSVKFDRQTISVYELLQIVNFDGLKFFTALVLFNQSDYMNFSKEDSDRLIVGCFIRE